MTFTTISLTSMIGTEIKSGHETLFRGPIASTAYFSMLSTAHVSCTETLIREYALAQSRC